MIATAPPHDNLPISNAIGSEHCQSLLVSLPVILAMFNAISINEINKKDEENYSNKNMFSELQTTLQCYIGAVSQQLS